MNYVNWLRVKDINNFSKMCYALPLTINTIPETIKIMEIMVFTIKIPFEVRRFLNRFATEIFMRSVAK